MPKNKYIRFTFTFLYLKYVYDDMPHFVDYRYDLSTYSTYTGLRTMLAKQIIKVFS